MLKLTVNNRLKLEADASTSMLDGKPFIFDLAEVKKGVFHILMDNKSFLAEVLEANTAEKRFVIRVNGNRYEVEARDRFDALLHQLGMDKVGSAHAGDLKAPMPGLVLEVKVKEGDTINKGDAVLVLEAMKMENILKAVGNAVVKKVLVKKGDKVEKGQVMVEMSL